MENVDLSSDEILSDEAYDLAQGRSIILTFPSLITGTLITLMIIDWIQGSFMVRPHWIPYIAICILVLIQILIVYNTTKKTGKRRISFRGNFGLIGLIGFISFLPSFIMAIPVLILVSIPFGAVIDVIYGVLQGIFTLFKMEFPNSNRKMIKNLEFLGKKLQTFIDFLKN